MPRKEPERYEPVLMRHGFIPTKTISARDRGSIIVFTNTAGSHVVVYTSINSKTGKVYQSASHNMTPSASGIEYSPPTKRKFFLSRRDLECWCWYEFERGNNEHKENSVSK